MVVGVDSNVNLNVMFLFLNIIVATVIVAFHGRWRALREKIRERRENFIAYTDLNRGRGPNNQYLRLPFLHYRFLGGKIGFVEIGDFMMQWGKVHHDTTVAFVDKFERCCGCVCTPARGGCGKYNISVKSVSSTGFDVYAASCERPFYYIAYGSRYKYEEEER